MFYLMNFSCHIKDNPLLGQFHDLRRGLCLFCLLVLLLSSLFLKYVRQELQQVFHCVLVNNYHFLTLLSSHAFHCIHTSLILASLYSLLIPPFPAVLTHQFPCKIHSSLFLLRSLVHNRNTWNLVKLAYQFPYCRWNASRGGILQWVSNNISCMPY